ncbi:MAG: hypothetical protein LBO66_08185 [Deltaproteobacteria bacterium]|jgi:hypothetical protein|nr:hypothetical protein [Deltaproteobacteria bacterium]
MKKAVFAALTLGNGALSVAVLLFCGLAAWSLSQDGVQDERENTRALVPAPSAAGQSLSPLCPPAPLISPAPLEATKALEPSDILEPLEIVVKDALEPSDILEPLEIVVKDALEPSETLDPLKIVAKNALEPSDILEPLEIVVKDTLEPSELLDPLKIVAPKTRDAANVGPGKNARAEKNDGAEKNAAAPPAPWTAAELSARVLSFSRGKAFLEFSFLTEEGLTGAIIRGKNPVTGEPTDKEIVGFFQRDGSLSIGAFFDARGENMSRKYHNVPLAFNLMSLNGRLFDGENFAPTGLFEFYGQNPPGAPKLPRILEERVFIFFDPLCPHGQKAIAEENTRALRALGKTPVLVPIATLEGSLVYGERYLATGDLNPSVDELLPEKLFFLNSPDSAGAREIWGRAHGPLPQPEDWSGPSRVLENTWRLRALLGDGAPLASPVWAWLEEGNLRTLVGSRDADELYALFGSSHASGNALPSLDENYLQ